MNEILAVRWLRFETLKIHVMAATLLDASHSDLLEEESKRRFMSNLRWTSHSLVLSAKVQERKGAVMQASRFPVLPSFSNVSQVSKMEGESDSMLEGS